MHARGRCPRTHWPSPDASAPVARICLLCRKCGNKRYSENFGGAHFRRVLAVARSALWLLGAAVTAGHNTDAPSSAAQCGGRVAFAWMGGAVRRRCFALRRFVARRAHGAVARAHGGGALTAMSCDALGDRLTMPAVAYGVGMARAVASRRYARIHLRLFARSSVGGARH